MSGEKLCHWVSARIESDGEGLKKLVDDKGLRLWGFPDSWTDEQIERALHFANNAYEKGCRAGRRQQMQDLRNVFSSLFGGIVQSNNL